MLKYERIPFLRTTGRRKGLQGNLPGVVEEALISLDAGQPIYLAGGFGGVTMDIL
jgi:SLOG-like protein